MDVTRFLQGIQLNQHYGGQLTHIEVLPERKGAYRTPREPLPRELADLLRTQGIDRLYEHQADALDQVREGQDVVVVTGTASGKTLCYNLPILERCLRDPDARALYLFPTKALAQDQLKGLLELLAGCQEVADQIRPGVYDGDTPTARA